MNYMKVPISLSVVETESAAVLDVTTDTGKENVRYMALRVHSTTGTASCSRPIRPALPFSPWPQTHWTAHHDWCETVTWHIARSGSLDSAERHCCSRRAARVDVRYVSIPGSFRLTTDSMSMGKQCSFTDEVLAGGLNL